MTREGVDAIWRSVESMYATGMHPGISLVVRRHGQVVLKRAIGHAKGNGPGDVDGKLVPMTPDTPVCIFSASKAMAAMTVHLLSERKQLSLLDPVSHYIPEFAQNGKRDITIYQLLCHKAGIPTIPTNGVDVAELLLDHKIQRLIYRTAPEQPGRHHAYHALTAGFVIADLVERVSKRSFRGFFRDNISRPLGLRHSIRRAWRRTGPARAQLRRRLQDQRAGGHVPETRDRHFAGRRSEAVERPALLPGCNPGRQRRRHGG